MRLLGGREKAISLLGCVLVLLSLIAPRLIVHRHADFDASCASSNALAQQALAEHCARFHRAPTTSIDGLEMHVHWGFSFPCGELPDDTPTDRGLMIAGSTYDISIDANQDAFVILAWQMTSSSTSLSSRGDHFSGSRLVSADFKRLFFGVWNI